MDVYADLCLLDVLRGNCLLTGWIKADQIKCILCLEMNILQVQSNYIDFLHNNIEFFQFDCSQTLKIANTMWTKLHTQSK